METTKNQQWTKKMENRAMITKMLDEIGLDYLRFLKIKTKTKKNPVRQTMIIEVFNMNSISEEKVLLDIKVGFPSWEQMMDVTLNMGADCDYKVVAFDATDIDEIDCSRGYCADTIIGFTQLNNEHGLKTYLLRVDEANGDYKNGLKFNLIKKPELLYTYDTEEYPSLEDLKRSEYWVLHHGFDNENYESFLSNPQHWFSFRFYEESENIGFLITWDEYGVFIEIVARSLKAMNIVNSKLMTANEKFEENYIAKELICDGQSKYPLQWILMIFPEPYQFFYELSQECKICVSWHIHQCVKNIKNIFLPENKES